MLTSAVMEFVKQQRPGFIASVNDDGTRNLSYTGTLMVRDKKHLIFADLRSPQTISNISKNPAVDINVVDVFRRKGFRFKGTATVIKIMMMLNPSA